MDSIYVTSDKIDVNSGAGLVCYHETQALAQVTQLKKIITRDDLIETWNNYDFNPFLMDYFTARLDIPKYPDLLHLSCSPGLAILEAIQPRKYVVNVVAHDLQTSIEEHERYYGPGSYGLRHNLNPWLHDLLLRHAKAADWILTPATSSANWIKKNIREDRIRVIPHGSNFPKDVPPLPAEMTFGYLGAFGPDKGLLYLAVAWEGFFATIQQGRMLWGGNCKNSIEQLAPKIMQSGGWQTTGWIKDVDDFYKDVSVYIQPSVTEGWGIEIGEAMGNGRPVIAAAGAGGCDMISDGVNGFIVPIRDAQAIYDKMVWFHNNPNAIIDMGERARETAEKYTWDIIEESYKEFYREVLK
jgi:glycosyltransferase involved in cell wall biosynthesis